MVIGVYTKDANFTIHISKMDEQANKKEQIIKRATECYEEPMSKILVVECTEEKFDEAAMEIKGCKPLGMGFDTKTQQGSKLASIVTFSLDAGRSYIFPLRKYWDLHGEIPVSVKGLMQTPHIIKFMFDPLSRMEALKGYKIRLDGAIDLRAAARIRGFQKTGIESLTGQLFRTAYHRHPHKRERKKYMQSKWEETISTEMAEYTASRASLTMVIYSALCNESLKMYQPLPEE